MSKDNSGSRGVDAAGRIIEAEEAPAATHAFALNFDDDTFFDLDELTKPLSERAPLPAPTAPAPSEPSEETPALALVGRDDRHLDPRAPASAEDRQQQHAIMDTRLRLNLRANLNASRQTRKSGLSDDSLIGNLLLTMRRILLALQLPHTWAEVATRVKTAQPSLSRWRRGHVAPTLETVVKLVADWNRSLDAEDAHISLLLGHGFTWQIIVGPRGRSGVISGSLIFNPRDPGSVPSPEEM